MFLNYYILQTSGGNEDIKCGKRAIIALQLPTHVKLIKTLAHFTGTVSRKSVSGMI
jgi:hypothetical protein